MKTTSPVSKIEFLNSKHLDKGTERTPNIKAWQLRIAQTGFQTVGRLFPQFRTQQAYKIFSTPRIPLSKSGQKTLKQLHYA